MKCECGAWAKVEATRKTADGVVRVYACGGGHKFRTDGKPVATRSAARERHAAMAAALASGKTTREVAAEFGVSQPAVVLGVAANAERMKRAAQA